MEIKKTLLSRFQNCWSINKPTVLRWRWWYFEVLKYNQIKARDEKPSLYSAEGYVENDAKHFDGVFY
jgi:hypothetical protein